MKWCEQCGEDVGYVERQVADDPHGLAYYELACEQCEASLALVVVDVEPSEVDALVAKFRENWSLEVRKAIADAARAANSQASAEQ